MRMILIFLLTIPLFSSAQNRRVFSSHDSISYNQKAISFIKQVCQKQLADSSFILADNPDYQNVCIEFYLKDSTTFTEEELMSLRKKHYPAPEKWIAAWFPEIKVADVDSIDRLFPNLENGWGSRSNSNGPGFYTFSMPIFFRNDTFCLFYVGHSSPGEGEGQFLLYQQENDLWKALKAPACTWGT